MADIPDDVMSMAERCLYDAQRGALRPLDGTNPVTVLEIIARAILTERARCLKIAEAFDGKPCGPAQLWTEAERQFFDAGQLDATTSIAAAIRGS